MAGGGAWEMMRFHDGADDEADDDDAPVLTRRGTEAGRLPSHRSSSPKVFLLLWRADGEPRGDVF